MARFWHNIKEKMSPGSKILKFILLVLLCFLTVLVKELKSQVSPLNIYLSTNVNSVTDTIAYPKASMGIGNMYGIEDWTYNSPELDLYQVFNGSQSLYIAEMIIRWDISKVSISAQPGNLFDTYFFDTISTSAGNLKINIASLNGNVMPAFGKYLIRLKVKLLNPGYSKVLLANTDYRFFDNINNNQLQIPLTVNNAEVKFYLGDFARKRTVIDIGDGDVNFKDASVFFQHYNSFAGDGIFRTKLDIASSGNLNYFSMPVPDGQIDFWDMVMFVSGYTKEGSGQLDSITISGKNRVLNKNTIFYSFGNIIKEGTNIKVPLKISGDLNILHGLSIGAIFNTKYYEFTGISNEGFFDSRNSFSAHRLQGSTVFFDAVTLKNTGYSNSGEIIAGYMTFKEKSIPPNENIGISLISCDAVDYNNSSIKTELINKVK
jgi:hypothetical protein